MTLVKGRLVRSGRSGIMEWSDNLIICQVWRTVNMRITQVTATPVRVDDTKPKSWLSESLVANPMSIYPEYRAKRSSWDAQWGPELLVQIETYGGISGSGCP